MLINKPFFKILLLSLSLFLYADICSAATEFVSTINKTGEDYNTLTLWEAAMDDSGVITATDIKVFSGSVTGTIADNATVTLYRGGVDQGKTGTSRHDTATQILVDAITAGATFQVADQWRVDASNYFTISDTGDTPIITASCYDDDGVLDDRVVINGFTTSATNYVKITVPAGERHSGTLSNGASGNGFLINPSAAGSVIALEDDYCVVEWVQVTDWGADWNGDAAIVISGTGAGAADNCTVHHTILALPVSGNRGDGVWIAWATGETIYRNIIYGDADYDLKYGIIHSGGANYPWKAYNNIIYWAKYDGSGRGIEDDTVSGTTAQGDIQNNIAMNCDVDFGKGTTSWNANANYNVSADTSAPGANSLISKTASSQFTNLTAGSENFHIKDTTADIDDAGTNLGSPYDYDIDNVQVTGTWDIGADEYVVLNSAPTITSVTDYPDPLEVSKTITFSVDWNDADTEGIYMYICKAEDGGTSGCGGGGTWCSYTATYTATDPITCTYAVQTADVGTKNYYAYVCDDAPSCSSATSGTFTVQSASTGSIRIQGGTRIQGGVRFGD